MEFVSPYVLNLYSPVYDIYTLVGLLGCDPIISQGILTQTLCLLPVLSSSKPFRLISSRR